MNNVLKDKMVYILKLSLFLIITFLILPKISHVLTIGNYISTFSDSYYLHVGPIFLFWLVIEIIVFGVVLFLLSFFGSHFFPKNNRALGSLLVIFLYYIGTIIVTVYIFSVNPVAIGSVVEGNFLNHNIRYENSNTYHYFLGSWVIFDIIYFYPIYLKASFLLNVFFHFSILVFCTTAIGVPWKMYKLNSRC